MYAFVFDTVCIRQSDYISSLFCWNGNKLDEYNGDCSFLSVKSKDLLLETISLAALQK